MKKLTILVDMDDVLENLVECWVDELNKKCGSSLCEEDCSNAERPGYPKEID